MKIDSIASVAILLWIAFLGCTKEPVAGPVDKSRGTELPAPTPPKPTTSRHRAACEGLERAGCKEAHPKTGTCEGDLAQAEGYGETVNLDCFASSITPDAVRKCGGPGLYTVRCLP